MLRKHLLTEAGPRNSRLDVRPIDMDKMKDKAFVKQCITDISTKGIKFLYHKESNNSGLSRSDRVLVRLHMCSQGGNGKFSEPRLVITSEEDEFVLIFDIFDVRSLEKASVMKLKAYPLSLPRNRVAKCPNYRTIRWFVSVMEITCWKRLMSHFVHGMRWLIARLSFNLMLGNASVGSELLVPISDEIQLYRAMNDVSNHLADKATQFVVI